MSLANQPRAGYVADVRASHGRLARVGLAAVLVALAGSAVAATGASGERLTIEQRQLITAELRDAIERDPGVIKKRWFLQRASLVSFVLPVTIRLTPARDATTFSSNDVTGNYATLDLGQSLGTRIIGLAGYVDAEIQFRDAYQSGHPGDVDVRILPDDARITSTSIGLLTNRDVSTKTRSAGGCADFAGNGTGSDVDTLDKMGASLDPGTNNIGPNSQWLPLGGTNEKDVVLRTGPLLLGIDQAGEAAVPAGMLAAGTTGNGAGLTQVGPSGGRANIFGLSVTSAGDGGHSVDVTVNLKTKVNTIARQVDGSFPDFDADPDPLLARLANEYECRQVWTGYIETHLQGIQLVGSLRIAPAITADGRLRIAKVFLASQQASRQALAACLRPFALFAAGNPATRDAAFTTSAPWGANPIGPNLIDGNPTISSFNATQSINPSTSSTAPDVPCDASGGPFNRAPFNVSAGSSAGLDEILKAGAAQAVSADLTVQRLVGEVIIGHFPSPPSVAVVPPGGAQLVAGVKLTPGKAGVKGKTGCPTRPFTISLRGTSMAAVVFKVDGRVVDRFPNVVGNTATIRITPRRFKVGLHRVTALVTFTTGSGTAARTLRLTFQRCEALAAPRFTG